MLWGNVYWVIISVSCLRLGHCCLGIVRVGITPFQRKKILLKVSKRICSTERSENANWSRTMCHIFVVHWYSRFIFHRKPRKTFIRTFFSQGTHRRKMKAIITPSLVPIPKSPSLVMNNVYNDSMPKKATYPMTRAHHTLNIQKA